MGMAPLALIHIYVGGTVWEALEGVALLQKRVTEGGPTPFLVSPPFSIFWLVSCDVSSWLAAVPCRPACFHASCHEDNDL